MCGIFGCVLRQGAAASLIHAALKRLEYRGYDSVGEATVYEGRLYVKKDQGNVDEVHAKLHLDDLPGKIGVGHCLHPNTLIQLADGRITQISEIDGENDVLAYDFGKGKFVRARARVFRHKNFDHLYEIRTPSTHLVCTGEHKLWVAELDGGIREKKVKDIGKEDLLLRVEKISVSGRWRALKQIKAKRYFRLLPPAIDILKSCMKPSRKAVARKCNISRSALYHLLKGDRKARKDHLDALSKYIGVKLPPEFLIPSDTTHGKLVEFPSKTDEKLMRILGYVLGDGYVGKRSVRIKDANRELLEYYNNLFHEVFKIKGRVVRIRGVSAHLLEINSKYLCDWFRENFPEILNKECPGWLGELPTKEICAFIGGYFDAEGTVGVKSKQISCKSTDEKTLRMLQGFLARVGIFSSYARGKRQNSKWKDPHSLTLSQYQSVKLFTEKIQIGKKKLKLVERVLKELKPGLSYTHYKVPTKKSYLREFIQHPGLKGAGHLTDYSLQKIVNTGEAENAEFFDGYTNSPITYERISSIKKVGCDSEHVYDLEVPGFENFIANGVISHNSRWATHGAPLQKNAHPQLDCENRIAVVHNGVIENFSGLRQELEERGHIFQSKTDTEVIPHLIEDGMKAGLNFADAVREAVKRLEGSYAVAAVCTQEPDKIVCARKESPLVIGVGDDSVYCASDIPAFLPLTNKAIALHNGELVILADGKADIKKIEDGSSVEREPEVIDWNLEMAEKQGYPYFMLKEIHEQPESLRNTLRLQDQYLDLMATFLDRAREVFLMACGTSYHACIAAAHMFSKLAFRSAQPIIASEFVQRVGDSVSIDTAALAVSQSGETADTLSAVMHAGNRAATILGLTNVIGSTLTRVSRTYVCQQSGPEIGVAATKTYTAQVSVLAQVAIKLGEKRGKLFHEEAKALKKKLLQIPDIVEKVIQTQEEKIKGLAKKYKDKQCFFFLGRGISTATAYEGMLKLMEIAYVPAIAYPAGESKHGPISLIEKGFPVIFVCPNDSTRKAVIGNIMEMKARGATIIAVIEDGDEEIKNLADDYIEIPKGVPEVLTPLPYVIPLQLFAYHMAIERECNPDMPRNLAKSVTVL